jgi:hypothetical protein
MIYYCKIAGQICDCVNHEDGTCVLDGRCLVRFGREDECGGWDEPEGAEYIGEDDCDRLRVGWSM